MGKGIVLFKKHFRHYRKNKLAFIPGMMLFFFMIFLSFLDLLPSVMLNTVLGMLLVKRWSSQSFSSEKDNKTLETLLSSCISLKELFLTKIICTLVQASVYVLPAFVMHFIFLLLAPGGFSPLKGIIALLCGGFTLLMITVYGTVLSAVSPDQKTANAKVSPVSYFLMIAQLILYSTLFSDNIYLFFVIVFAVCSAQLAILIYTLHQLRGMTYEIVLIHKPSAAKSFRSLSMHISPNHRVYTILLHEYRYFSTLKNLRRSFIFIMLAPPLFILLAIYYFDLADYSVAILVMALTAPRIPMNLTAYSISGEKVYKTFESLLSTPVKIRQLLIGKSLLSIFLSSGILLSGGILSILAYNFYIFFIKKQKLIIWPHIDHLLMFIAVFLSCMLMIFITAYLTMLMKTARRGLYISSIISFLFILPPAGIYFLIPGKLLWTFVYMCSLFLLNLIALHLTITIDREKIIFNISS